LSKMLINLRSVLELCDIINTLTSFSLTFSMRELVASSFLFWDQHSFFKVTDLATIVKFVCFTIIWILIVFTTFEALNVWGAWLTASQSTSLSLPIFLARLPSLFLLSSTTLAIVTISSSCPPRPPPPKPFRIL